MSRRLICSLAFIVLTHSAVALGARAVDAPLLPTLSHELSAAGGTVQIDRHWHPAVQSSLRFGLADGVELAAPLAIAVRLVPTGDGSAIYGGVGIGDFHIPDDGGVLWSPQVVVAAHARLGTEAALRVAFDLSGVERNTGSDQHAAWLRGAAALLIDVGPHLTIAFGAAFQRYGFGERDSSRDTRAGWVGDARFSLGSVRTQPFRDLPVLTVNISDQIHILGFTRFDINTDTDTTDTRLLLGIELIHH